MERQEIIIVGSGGQGIVLAGEIIATAATIDGKFATQTSTYGAMQRGAPVHSDIIISSAPIKFTFVRRPDIFIAMNQEGFDEFSEKAMKGALIMVDTELVNVHGTEFKSVSVLATRTATELGSPVVANMVMVGAFAAVTGIVTKNGIEKAVEQKVSGEFAVKNLDAVNRGYKLVRKLERVT